MIERCVTCGQRKRKGSASHRCNTQRKAKRELGSRVSSWSNSPSDRPNKPKRELKPVYAMDFSRERGHHDSIGYRVL